MTVTRRLSLSVASVFAVFAIALSLFATSFAPGASAQDSTPEASPGASPAAEAAFTYTVDAEQSTASYEVDEELEGLGDNTVVGTTNAIQGFLLFDENMTPIAGSRIDVDMRTLQTDEARRDNYLYDNVLETGEFPLGTFIVTGVEGLDGGLVDGEEVTFQLIGDLSLHGVTNEATWEVTATLDGETLTGSASTSFLLEDFEMEKPIVGPVISIEDTIDLKMDVVAVPAA